MRRRRLLLLPALALGLVPMSGAGATTAWAGPPEVLTGDVAIDPLSFEFTRGEPTGAVGRFSMSFRATVLGDLAGTTSESWDCMEVRDVVRCRGGGTTQAPDGSTGTIRGTLTCTPLPELACEGRAQGRGVTADGERLVWMTEVSPAGPFRATYVTRMVQGPG